MSKNEPSKKWKRKYDYNKDHGLSNTTVTVTRSYHVVVYTVIISILST